MPNGTTIELQNAASCPSGATKAQTLDGKPAPIRPGAQVKNTAPTTKPAQTPAPAAAPPDGLFITKDDLPGCVRREDFDALTNMARSGDMEAFKKLSLAGWVSGRCTVFKKGQRVYLEETAFWSGMQRLRIHGETKSYWTILEATK